ncbi:MAG: phage integrase N-terminal SAM-like domain-containing protein [Burkholderiales bacterium]|nr:phage integrase N-terminal SAM-like domain-containing protein [Burkholderiales bacterium]
MLERLRIHLRTRHCSIRTEEACVDRVRQFIVFHGKRHPQDLGAVEVGSFPQRARAAARSSSLCSAQAAWRRVMAATSAFAQARRRLRSSAHASAGSAAPKTKAKSANLGSASGSVAVTASAAIRPPSKAPAAMARVTPSSSSK